MKKILAMMLTAAMMLSMGTAAMAANVDKDGDVITYPEENSYTDIVKVTLDKTYTVINEGTTTYPTEKFEFAITRDGVTDAADGVTAENMPLPTIVDGGVEFTSASATSTKQITIELPTYTSVGVYTYIIRETVGDTAGVTYWENADGTAKEINLKVTVIEDEETGKIRVAAVRTDDGTAKSDDIENVYKAGAISVKKTVTGILGDKEKYFAITITLTGVDGEDYSGNVITVGDTSYEKNPTSVVVGTPATFYLKDGETINLGNIPYGVTYTVTEENLEDYNGIITGGDANGVGTVDSANETLVDVTNDKGGTVDTGISVDSIPYIAMLGVVALGGTGFIVSKKRRSED